MLSARGGLFAKTAATDKHDPCKLIFQDLTPAFTAFSLFFFGLTYLPDDFINYLIEKKIIPQICVLISQHNRRNSVAASKQGIVQKGFQQGSKGMSKKENKMKKYLLIFLLMFSLFAPAKSISSEDKAYYIKIPPQNFFIEIYEDGKKIENRFLYVDLKILDRKDAQWTTIFLDGSRRCIKKDTRRNDSERNKDKKYF